MSEQSLHRRRADLIRQLNEIEDEELLVSLEDQICHPPPYGKK